MAKCGGLSIGDITRITGSSVRVREAPVDGATLYTSSKNDEVKIMPNGKRACSDNFYWYLIGNRTQTGRPYGWIRGDFLAGSDGEDDGGDSSIPGVTGNGPNSNISAAMIRAGENYWRYDVSTKHPQIKQLQAMLNAFFDKYLQFDGYYPLEYDGVYGENTRIYVRLLQQYSKLPLDLYNENASTPVYELPQLAVDGRFGKDSLHLIETLYGRIS